MEEIRPILSIIVPIYNVEKYLSLCIDGILVQTFTNFELILVDDGSTDSSGKLCDEYMKKDNRIIVIHQQNGGAWSARNAGIDRARGIYIMFVDPDDILGTKDTIEKNIELIVQMKGRCIVQFPVLWYYGENDKFFRFESCIYTKDTIFKALFNNHITSTVWDKIYARKVFDNVRFPKLRYYEDSYCMIDILNNTDKVLISDQGFYKYCIRERSAMKSDLSVQKLDDFFSMIVRFMAIASGVSGTELYQVQTFLEMEDKLAYGKSLISKEAFEKYCGQISNFIPGYEAIFYYIFKRNFRKGLKIFFIKLVGLKFFYRLF